MRASLSNRAIALGGLCLLVTCYWSEGTPLPPAPITVDPSSAEGSLAPVRRLTRAEYNNTVRDLLGDATRPADSFPADDQNGALADDANDQSTSPLQEQRYSDAAQRLAANAITNLPALLACNATEDARACASRFVSRFGRRAWRRTLSPDEAARFMAMYDAAASPNDAVTSIIESMLVSPYFLYRPEPGVAGGRLTNWEIAARLSYFFWATTPDDDLLDRASRGELGTREQVAARAQAMFADPRAKDGVSALFQSWLGLDDLSNVARSQTDYPEFTPALHAAMGKETIRLVQWVLWESDGTLETLLTAPVTFVDSNLAALYGVPAPAGNELARVDLDPAQRSGVLTQPSLMAIYSKPNQSSPIHRGKFVRERLLCQKLPDPPNNLNVFPPDVLPGQTTRQRFEVHTKDALCAGCHGQMDPIGFGFESFDPIGKYRTLDQGLPVDTNGKLTGTDVDGDFTGAPALAKMLAQSAMVRDCVVRQLFRYSLGRFESVEDEPSLGSAQTAFAKGDLRALIVALATTDAFLGKEVAQ